MKHKDPKAPKCPKCGEQMVHGYDTRHKPRWVCRTQGKYCYSTVATKPGEVANTAGDLAKKPKPFKRPLGDSKIFVVTAAQNATPVHEQFFQALERYCDYRDAQLLVVPIRYKNATSVWTASQRNAEWWFSEPYYDHEKEKWVYDPKTKYLWNVRRKLNDNLVLLGDIRTQPTAQRPLAGFEGVTHGESCILAHTKVELRTVPAPQGSLPKIMTTTGACTQSNYTDTKAGKLGEFHHTLGAVVVEIKNDKIFHIRQINGQRKDGMFYDIPDGQLMYFNSSGAFLSTERLKGIAMGDTHLRAIDPKVQKATFEEMVPQLDPEELLYHDLVDGQTVNHHTDDNPFVTTARSYAGQDNVEAEMREAIQFVRDMGKGRKSVIVRSNHNDWLQQWIEEKNWKTLPSKNREFYLQMALDLVRAAQKTNPDQAERLDAFVLFAKRELANDKDIRVLDYDESYKLGDIECGQHGHLGPNGARGTAANYAKLGVKTIAGDCHSPAIVDGAFRCGTSTHLRRGYNAGPSGWLNTHALVYPNSKRTLVHIINGEWRI